MQTKKEKIRDAILVIDCQQGNVSAFTEIVFRWQERLQRHAYSIIGNEEVARDILQETWIVLLEKIDGLDDPNALSTWLYRIVGNKCVDWLRKRKKEKSMMSHYHRQENQSDISSDVADLTSAMKKLLPEQRELISMYYGQNLSVGDIAKILQIKSGTVKSRLYYIREKLRELMEGSHNG